MDELNDVAGAASPAAPAMPARRRHRGLRLLTGLLIVLVVLTALLASFGWWAVRSERGTAWLLTVLPNVRVDQPKGALLGDFEAASVVATLPGGKDRVTLTGLHWHGWTLARGSGDLWAHVSLDSVQVRRIDVVLAPKPTPASKPEPLRPPRDLKLPVEVDLRSLTVGELHATPLGDEPLRNIDAALHLGADAGALHRIDHLTLGRDRLTATGQASMATSGSMAVNASVSLAQDAAQNLPVWAATASLNGPLAEPVLTAQLRASPLADQKAQTPQTLDAQVALRPFAAWPLGRLNASAEGLDLSAFSSAAPVTALTLQAHADSSAAGQPIDVAVDLTNAAAGRWDEARLPLQSLALQLGVRPDAPGDIELRALSAELGTAKAPGGKITATGRWAADRWRLDAALAALKPARLDARAPLLDLTGPITATGQRSTAAGPAGNMRVDLKSSLTGNLIDRKTARPVALRIDAAVDPQHIDLRELVATAGTARVTATGDASQASPDAPWAVKAQARIANLDPASWWPGDPASPWGSARNDLNAALAVEAAVPAPAAGQTAAQTLEASRGTLGITIEPSLLAGVALNGTVQLHAQTQGQTKGVADVTANLDAGGNGVRLEGRLLTSPGSSEAASKSMPGAVADTWALSLDAPSLDRLAPIFKLFQPTGTDATLAGALTAHAKVIGRWPAMTTQGDLDATGVRVGGIGIQQTHAQWTAGTSPTDAVDLQATLTQASVVQKGSPGPSIETASLQLKGSARAHTLTLRADSKARPPAWVEASLSEPKPARSQATAVSGMPKPTAATPSRTLTVATLRLQGGLVDQPGAALSGWRGTLQQLQLRSSDERTPALLRITDVGFEAFWAGSPPRAAVQAGRLELLGGSLRWDRLAWAAGDAASGAPPRIDADARLEPFRIAPLLAAAQPDLGWGGDLSIAGHVSVHSAPSFTADVVIERSRGDLTLSDELGSHPVGLTDLRLGLSAADGVWNFTTGVAGRALGVTSGAVVVRTSPQAVWPAAEAALQGVLEVQVADLGALSAWVPPGWRVGGGVHANVNLAGRFGAPEYTGGIQGTQLSVRNFLEGVKVTDGDLAIRLDGTRATVERFTAKGGDGTLRIEGDAAFGEAPQANLKISADKFVLLGRVDRRIVASGSGALRIDNQSLAFNGGFNVDEGLIDFSRSDAPSLSDDVQVLRVAGVPSPAAAASAAASPKTATGAGVPLPVTPAAPRRAMAVDLRVDLGSKLALRGHGLDAHLAGELKVTSPDSKLAVNGTVRVVDGTYEAYGQNLVIDRGLVVFSGPVDRPRLDIEATRPKLDNIRVGVLITGSATNPRVRLFSEPDLSEVDKLSWLVLGHASDDVGRAENALLQRAALALVSGEGPGVTDKVTKALGLDELSLSQSDGEVKQTVLSVGKKLSERWSIGYEHGLNAATGSFQLIYKIAQRFTLRAQSGDDNSVDLVWTWRWQ